MFGLSGLGRASSCGPTVVLGIAAVLFAQNAQAGTGSIGAATPGPTPFISNVSATFSGGTLKSIGYGIVPKTGSLTRPLVTSYSPQYLAATNNLQGNSVTIPVFGLYAGYTNTVQIYFFFTDGSQTMQPITITTAAYTDSCVQLNSPTFTQNRVNTSDLNFDFFLVKESCSANNPTLVDTDGNIRWVGQANDPVSSVAIYNNVIYLSDGKSGILSMPLTTATATKLADFSAAPYNVTFTGHHNIDPGRNGLIVDVNTTSQTEAVDIEFNPTSGAVINSWDLGQIISYTMTKGGDDPSKFVLGTSADWFHNNATAYNPADNTLIVSSRENFVVAVDYDTPADGQKKIHWILGDTSKAWHAYPTLTALMLKPTNANTLPPIGQHAVSIDHNGNLLLFDDGFQSLVQVPAGNSRTYSAVREYQINVSAMTATQGPVYYSPNPAIFNPICGSVYDVNNTFLVDFPTAGATSSLTAPANAILQGLGNNAGNVVFSLQYSQPSYCSIGWNSYPLPSNVFTFGGAATIPVNLAAVFNIHGIFNNGSAVTNGGLDTASYAYSANLLGPNLTVNGVSYSFGTAGTANAVSSATITLPAGNYQTLNFVGAAIFGNQPGQPFIVTYSDGSTATFSQSISDWATPQSYSGESTALTMPYRLTSNGSQQNQAFSLYSYSFALNSSKTVKSFTLPNSRNVTVLAVSLLPSSTSSTPAAQTITFAPLSGQIVGGSVNLSATASSGLPVTFASSTPSVCTVNNSTASLIGAGTCTISASQPGNASFAPAASVSQSFGVASKPFFTLATSAAQLTIRPQFCYFFYCYPATPGADTITLTPGSGFSGPVSFTIAGLPSGVTASFSPSSVTTSGSTKLTLTAGPVGSGRTATLTITGTSGSVTATTAIALSY